MDNLCSYQLSCGGPVTCLEMSDNPEGQIARCNQNAPEKQNLFVSLKVYWFDIIIQLRKG